MNMKSKQNRTTPQSELLDSFPEAKRIIPELITESEQWRSVLVKRIAARLSAIKYESPDESFYDFWRSWLKVTLGQDLVEIDEQIALLNRKLESHENHQS